MGWVLVVGEALIPGSGFHDRKLNVPFAHRRHVGSIAVPARSPTRVDRVPTAVLYSPAMILGRGQLEPRGQAGARSVRKVQRMHQLARSIAFDARKYGPPLLADAADPATLPGFITTSMPHRLAFWEVALVGQASGHVDLDGERIDMRARRLIVTAPGQRRSWSLARERLAGRLVFFEPQWIEAFTGLAPTQAFPFLAACAGQRSIDLDAAQFRRLATIADAMRDELSTLQHDAEHALRALLYQMLVAVQRAFGGPSRGARSSREWSRANVRPTGGRALHHREPRARLRGGDRHFQSASQCLRACVHGSLRERRHPRPARGRGAATVAGAGQLGRADRRSARFLRRVVLRAVLPSPCRADAGTVPATSRTSHCASQM